MKSIYVTNIIAGNLSLLSHINVVQKVFKNVESFFWDFVKQPDILLHMTYRQKMTKNVCLIFLPIQYICGRSYVTE